MLANDGELGRGPADALLCVSGSHPARKLPFAGRSVRVSQTTRRKWFVAAHRGCCSAESRIMPSCRFLPDSFAVLRLAQQMKRAGDLPASLALLAAENPLLDHPSRLEQKARTTLRWRLA